jgi:hypothetical protein
MTTPRATLIDDAENLRRSYLGQLAQIRQDRDLSEAAKRRQISELYNHTAAAIRELRRRYDELVTDERAALLKAAFGPFIAAGSTAGDREATIASHRVAVAQAEGMSDLAGLERLLRQAKVTGDRQLERAIAYVAYERGQARILDRIGGDDVAALRRLDAELRDSQTRFATSMVFTVPSRPVEASLSTAMVDE